jgi:hypothetical protein
MADTNLLLSGKVDYAEPTPGDQSVIPLSFNNDGRVRVSSKPGQFPIIAGGLTTLNQVLSMDVQDASNIVVHVKNTGTVTQAAGTFVFEGSIDSTDGNDGTWFGVQAVRSNANIIENGVATALALVAGAGALYSWELSVNAVKFFRIRCTVAVTASSIAYWTVIRGSYATEPIPAVQTHAVTGTVTSVPAGTSGVVYALTSAATTNAVLIKSTATNVYELTAFNATAATIYLKLFNKATAPVPGTDVPLITIPIAAGALVQYEFGAIGKRFSLGLGIAATAAAAATDATAIGVGAQISATYI